MTAVKSYKRDAPAHQMLTSRIAKIVSDSPIHIAFAIWNREGTKKQVVTIRKSDLNTTCTCDHEPFRRKNDENDSCWHMRKAMLSYLRRIQRGEVE